MYSIVNAPFGFAEGKWRTKYIMKTSCGTMLYQNVNFLKGILEEPFVSRRVALLLFCNITGSYSRPTKLKRYYLKFNDWFGKILLHNFGSEGGVFGLLSFVAIFDHHSTAAISCTLALHQPINTINTNAAMLPVISCSDIIFSKNSTFWHFSGPCGKFTVGMIIDTFAALRGKGRFMRI